MDVGVGIGGHVSVGVIVYLAVRGCNGATNWVGVDRVDGWVRVMTVEVRACSCIIIIAPLTFYPPSPSPRSSHECVCVSVLSVILRALIDHYDMLIRIYINTLTLTGIH